MIAHFDQPVGKPDDNNNKLREQIEIIASIFSAITRSQRVIEKERLETQKYLMQIEMCLANLDAAAMTDDEKNN
jgi:hypothetical protein|tara:strand:- start:41 stop:262 length:222 start_codon:yes stop_codon:yes gene_type:complete